MTAIVALDLTGWVPMLTPEAQQTAVRALERGGVLVLPHVAFELQEGERRFLSPRWSDGRAKNISFDGTKLKGARGTSDELAGSYSADTGRWIVCSSMCWPDTAACITWSEKHSQVVPGAKCTTCCAQSR